MASGTFKHANITTASKKSAECLLGWVAHYLIGIAFASVLVISTSGSWLQRPSLLPALLMGIGTVLIPFLIMQPSFGLGIAATKTQHASRAA